MASLRFWRSRKALGEARARVLQPPNPQVSIRPTDVGPNTFYGNTHRSLLNNPDSGNNDEYYNEWHNMMQIQLGFHRQRITELYNVTPSSHYRPINARDVQLTFSLNPLNKREHLITCNRQRARELRNRVAARKAEALLKENLSPEQREDYERRQKFRVIVGDRTYEIWRGRQGNVKLIDIQTGAPSASYCIHPDEPVPNADTMLAQKLLLETDEQEFLRVANVSPDHFSPQPPQLQSANF